MPDQKHKHSFDHFYYPYQKEDEKWYVGQLVCLCGESKKIKEKEW